MKKLAKGKSFFFRNEEGKNLFYPWGYPGTGFYVDEKQKKRIVRFLYTISFSLIVLFIASDLASRYELIDLYGKIIILNIAWIAFPAWYYYKIRIFTKDLVLNAVKIDKKPKIFYVLLFLLFIQFLNIISAIYAYAEAPALISLALLVQGLYSLILVYFITLSIRKVT